MRHMLLFAWPIVAFLLPVRSAAQDFRQSSVPITQQAVAFKLKTPIVHLALAAYAPSVNAVFAGTTTFRMYTRPASNIFLKVRWDMDASDGIAWSDWYDDQNNPAVVNWTYATPGKKTVTFDLRMYNTLGQEQQSTKTVEIVVVPFPTAMYADSHGNSIVYWQGADGVYDKPVLSLEGFDPENENQQVSSYAQGFDLAEAARSQGYDILFLNFADGGADAALNKDVFLGACAFAHDKLAGREAAVQVVGVSMGGAVARYGLAWAEERTRNGYPTEHYVNTFISFDAPQQGAHVNGNLQNLLKSRGTPTQQHTLQSTAAKEFLYDDVYGSLHASFYTAMTALNNTGTEYTNGYPRKCRNFAVSNGTFAPDYPSKVAGVDPLATLSIYKSLTLLFVDFDALVPDEIIDIQSVPRDLGPGSMYTYDLRSLNNSGGQRRYFASFPINLLFSGLGEWSFNIHFNPSYQPTEAALDLKGYTRSSDGSIVGGSSWFDETLVQQEAHRHDELTTDSKNKVLGWLNANRSYAYLSTPSIVGAKVVDGNGLQVSYSDPSVFEDGVIVERRTATGAFAAIGAAPANAGAYTDRDPALVPFASYTYRVRSYSGQRMSPASAEMSVLYQPHLVSSTPSALGAPAQHKALQTTADYNNRFMAYESADGAFLVQFIQEDEFAGTWSLERPIGGIPSALMKYRCPSLFPDSSGASARIIYDEVNAATGTHTIRQAVNDDASQSVALFPEALFQFPGPPEFVSAPAAVMTDHVENKLPALLAAVARYETNAGLALGLGVNAPSGALQWSMVDLNGGIFTAPVTFTANPSLAATMKDQGKAPAYHLYIVWEEENHGSVLGGIRLVHGAYTPGSQPWPPAASQIVWEAAQAFSVAQNTSAETHRRPSVVVDCSGNVCIAWESATASGGRILFQKRNGLTATSIIIGTTQVASGSGTAAMPHAVSVADERAVPGLGDNLTLVWSTDGGGSYTAWYQGASNIWSTPQLLDPSVRQPNIAVTKSASAEGRVVAASSPAGPPYAIRTLTVGPLPPLLPAPVLSWQPVMINNVKRAAFTWTAVGPDLQAYDLYLYSCALAAGNCGAEAYHSKVATTGGLAYTDMNTVVFTKSGTNLAPNTTNYYYVRARDRFNQQGAASNTVGVNTNEAIVWKVEPGGTERPLPATYGLSENFPNPFNPSTSFRYDLVAAGAVRIAVYNMIGEEVMTLVEAPQEAGSYVAIWDASGRPSGVYVAVMTVVGERGRVAYSAARKVLLVR